MRLPLSSSKGALLSCCRYNCLEVDVGDSVGTGVGSGVAVGVGVGTGVEVATGLATFVIFLVRVQ